MGDSHLPTHPMEKSPGSPQAHLRLTDVHDVSLLVDHDVAVVPVLDLQQEPDHAVRRHRSREGPPRPLESLGGSVCDRISY